jgi:hypothetical protein
LSDVNRPQTPERVELAGTAVGGGCIDKAVRAACSARTIRFGVLYEAVGAVCCWYVDDFQAAASGRNGYDAQRGQQWALGESGHSGDSPVICCLHAGSAVEVTARRVIDDNDTFR